MIKRLSCFFQSHRCHCLLPFTITFIIKKGTVSQMSYNLLVHFVNNKHIILLNEVLEISTTIKVEVSVIS